MADHDPPAPDIDISQIRENLATLSREFRVQISVLLTDLAFQGDTEMRFLGIRLNYNEVKIFPMTLEKSLIACQVYQLIRRSGGREKRGREPKHANVGIREEGETPIQNTQG